MCIQTFLKVTKVIINVYLKFLFVYRSLAVEENMEPDD